MSFNFTSNSQFYSFRFPRAISNTQYIFLSLNFFSNARIPPSGARRKILFKEAERKRCIGFHKSACFRFVLNAFNRPSSLSSPLQRVVDMLHNRILNRVHQLLLLRAPTSERTTTAMYTFAVGGGRCCSSSIDSLISSLGDISELSAARNVTQATRRGPPGPGGGGVCYRKERRKGGNCTWHWRGQFSPTSKVCVFI